MRKFGTPTSIPAPLDEANIDTDLILPARFLLLMNNTGLSKHLFKDRRTGDMRGPHFGIGSSREQAVWSLTDFGIRRIIAPSFGNIFFANCLKNSLLPVCLSGKKHEHLMQAAKGGTYITIDLPSQTIMVGSQKIPFKVPPRGKEQLLSGLDETAAILTHETSAIEAFERRQGTQQPWLYSRQTLNKRKTTS